MGMQNLARQVAAETAQCSPKELCTRAVAVLNGVLVQRPTERLSEIDQAERLIVRLRDCLIGKVRQGDAATKADAVPALKQVNMALSLVVGVEYPAAGVQVKPLEQARGALQELLDREWL